LKAVGNDFLRDCRDCSLCHRVRRCRQQTRSEATRTPAAASRPTIGGH